MHLSVGKLFFSSDVYYERGPISLTYLADWIK